MSLSNASKTWFPILSLPLLSYSDLPTSTSSNEALNNTQKNPCRSWSWGPRWPRGHEATRPRHMLLHHLHHMLSLSGSFLQHLFSPGGRQFFLLASRRHVGSDCEVCHISELRWSGSRYTKVDPALCYCQQRSSSLFLAIKPGITICTVAPLSIYGIRSM